MLAAAGLVGQLLLIQLQYLRWLCKLPPNRPRFPPPGLLALVQQMLGSQSDAMHIGQLSCSLTFGAQHPLLVWVYLVVWSKLCHVHIAGSVGFVHQA